MIYAYELTSTIVQMKNCNGTKYKDMIASKQWEWFEFIIFNILHNYSCSWYVVPEFHKPPNFNLHYHGIVLFEGELSKIDYADILKSFQFLGRCTFTKVNDYASWKKYMLKNNIEMSGYRNITENFELLESEYLRSR